MTDIKERLRGNSSHWSDVMRQAADEIERLEARVAELEGALDEYVHAMEGFAQAVRHVTDTPYPWPAQDVALPKARAALAKSGGETP